MKSLAVEKCIILVDSRDRLWQKCKLSFNKPKAEIKKLCYHNSRTVGLCHGLAENKRRNFL